MNNFEQLREKAVETWNQLQNSSIPVIYLGAGSCGNAAGAVDVLKTIQDTLASLSLDAQVVQVGCIGPCYLEPLMDIQLPGQPRVSFANVSPSKAKALIQKMASGDQAFLREGIGYFGEAGTSPAPGLPRFFDLPVMKHQTRLVLHNCGFIDPGNIDHYLANGGYQGARRAFQLGPEGTINEMKEAGLRGRGGAGFPTYKKWELCRRAPGKTKYVICNCSEGNPGAFMNRSLLEGDPHALLEGLLIAGYAIGASHAYIYVRPEYVMVASRLRKAITQMEAYGLMGENILDSGFDFDITLKVGAGAYVCGEETALIGSIEGKRGMPRSRPPFPATSGVFKKPSIIQNAESLGTIPNILRNGAQWYNQFGTPESPGTKTFALVGKVRRPGLIEVPLGTTLRKVIYDIGGGTRKPFKAIQTGGPSGGLLSEEFLDTPLDYEPIKSTGSAMGAGGLLVLDTDSCVVDLTLYFLDFAQKESCGKCSPCRVGTRHLYEMVQDISQGNAEPDTLIKLQSLAESILKGSLCGLGQTSPVMVLTTLRYFRTEYLNHIKEKYCSAAVCRDLIEYQIRPEKCNGCQRCVALCPTQAISGFRAEPQILDQSKCIKCKVCYETCRYDPMAGDAIVIRSKGKVHVE